MILQTRKMHDSLQEMFIGCNCSVQGAPRRVDSEAETEGERDGSGREPTVEEELNKPHGCELRTLICAD